MTRRHNTAGTASWGKPPLPLVPIVLRRAIGHLQAPSSVCNEAGRKLTLEELGRSIWDSCPAFSANARADLVRLCASRRADFEDLPITDDFASNRRALDALRVSGGTMAALRKTLGRGVESLQGLTFGALLSMRNIGIRRALELSAAMEIGDSETESRDVAPPELLEFFVAISRWAAGERGESVLGDLLPAPDPRWPEDVAASWLKLKQVSIEPFGPLSADAESAAPLLMRALSRCGEQVIVVMRARVLAISEPTRLEVLSAALGETPARLLELEQAGRDILAQLSLEAYRPVMRRAEKLRARIGAAAPLDDVAVDRALDLAVSDFSDRHFRELAREVFLWLAGPYHKHQGWLLIAENLVGQTVNAIIRFRGSDGGVDAKRLQDALCEIGIRPSCHDAWINWVVDVARIAYGESPREPAQAGSSKTQVA